MHRHTLLTAALAMLMTACASHSARRPVPIWKQQFTDAQLLALLQQREHQPIADWTGSSAGIAETGGGFGELLVTFRESSSHLIEAQLFRSSRLLEQPMLLVPLFDSRDPQTVLTALYVYKHFTPRTAEIRRWWPVAQAMREKLLGHPSMLVRCEAYWRLANNHWLNVDDLRRGLADRAADVRLIMAFWVINLTDGIPTDIHADAPLTPAQRAEIKRERVAVMMEHLDDPNLHVSENMYNGICQQLIRWTQTPSGRSYRLPPDMPPKTWWLHADWKTRREAKAQLQAWWAEHADEAIRFASSDSIDEQPPLAP